MANVCEPIKLQWPPRPRERTPDTPVEPATLVLRVIGAMAIEVQHMAPQIVQRVNAHLGWRAVGRLAIRQGPLERAAGPPLIAPPDPEAVEEAVRATEGVEDEALRKALILLGARAIRGRAGGEWRDALLMRGLSRRRDRRLYRPDLFSLQDLPMPFRSGLNRRALPQPGAAALIAAPLLTAGPVAAAEEGPTKIPLDQLLAPQALPDLWLGDPKAPVTIIEYASMTCSHCATSR